MKLTVEKVENGFLVTDESGKKWVALENEYVSRYETTLDRVMRNALKTDEPEPLKVAA